MKTQYFKIVSLILTSVLVLIGNTTYSQSPCSATNYNSAYVLNANDYPYFSPGSGVTVNATLTGGIGTLNNFQYACNGTPYNCTAPAWWMNNAAQSIILTFSQPVSSFSVIVNGTGNGEEFYFSSACGGTITLGLLCNNGWNLTNGGSATLYNGGGASSNLIVVNNTAGSTVYTLTHNGVSAGSRYALVDCFVTAPPPPGLTSTTAQTDASCSQCDGTATVNPSGGTVPYTYSWNTTPVQTTQTATNLCPGTYIVTFMDNSGCLSGMDTVTINQAPSPNPPVITPAGPFCLTDPPVNLITSNPGGTWSGTGITNPALGTFDPNTAGVGSHQIIYLDSGACAGADTINIAVNLAADATINPAGPFCLGNAPTNLTSVGVGGVWSGTGITNTANGTFDPMTAGVGTHTITYGIAGNCGDTQTVNIVVVPNDDPTITQAGPYCPLDAPVNLVAATGGGNWSGTGITNPATGTFDPFTAGTGNHIITYTIAGPCGGVDTMTITVVSSLNASINPVGPFCQNDPSLNLVAVDPGGTWSGAGITNTTTGTFDPNTAGPGNHTITYGIPGNCGDTQTVDILIIPNADATITPVGPFCINDAPINLVGVTPGGTWSGTGITSPALGTFDPMTAGVGTHTITYSIIGACGDVQTTTITVNPLDNPTITQVGPFCVSEPQTLLTSATPGGTWSGTGITNPAAGSFSPVAAGVGTHQIIYVTGGTCSDVDTIDIVVNPLPDVQFIVDTLAVCMTPSRPFEFTNTTDTTGGMVGTSAWDFGDGSTGSGSIVSHTYNAPGTYNVTLTVTSTTGAGGCSNTLVKNSFVQVYANPTADYLTTNNPATVFNPTVNFIDQSYTNIVNWDWNIGGLAYSNNQNPTYTFPEDTGTYLVTLTVTDNHDCQNTISDNVIIKGEHAVFVPNAFTPDFDNNNDGFHPNGFGVSHIGYEFYIFDRWGEQIFETQTKFAPWYGDYKNELVPNGVYVWRLVYRDLNGRIHKATGHVNVIR